MDNNIKRIKKFNDALSELLDNLEHDDRKCCQICSHWRRVGEGVDDYGKCETISNDDGILSAEIVLIEDYKFPSSKKDLFLETHKDFYCKLFEGA